MCTLGQSCYSYFFIISSIFVNWNFKLSSNCILINPGIPPKELWIENYFKNKNNKDDDINFSIKICKDCKIIIESNQYIEHCKICNICVLEKSYHCFWIGKCVGKRNKVCFYGFLFMTFILILYLVFAFVSIPFFRENINPK